MPNIILAYHMYAKTSPPTPSSLAFLSVIIPFDVEINAIPKPFNTLGSSSLAAYILNPGLLILLNPEITFLPFSVYFKLILIIPWFSFSISS